MTIKKIDNEETVIIETAIRLIQKNKLTMDKLALDSGVARASIYRKYGGKEKIIELIKEKTDYHIDKSMDVKTKILKASRIIFGKKGFYKATVEEIALEASVGTATVYRNFETKEKLIHAFKEKYTPGSIIGSLTIEDNTDLVEALYFITYKGLDFITNNRDLFRMSFFEGDEGLDYYRTALDQTNRTIPILTDFFTKLISLGKIKDIDPQIMAYSLLGLIMGHGYIKQAYSGEHLESLEEIARIIANIFLKGIKI